MSRHLLAIHDHRDGHRSQAVGLAEALGRQADLPVLVRRADALPDGPAPGCAAVISAGGRCGWRAIRWARRLRCPLIGVMNPGWPMRWWFDLLVVPAHDGLPASHRVLISEGALNPVRPGRCLHTDQELVLVGGISRHHGWDQARVLAQVAALVDRRSAARFAITTSRRTPAAAVAALAAWAQGRAGVDFQPWPGTPSGWLAERFDACATAWVTADSVSMAFEALSAGAALGLIALPVDRPRHRVPQLMERLVAQGRAVWADDHLAGTALPAAGRPLQEAERIAGEILRRLPAIGGRP